MAHGRMGWTCHAETSSWGFVHLLIPSSAKYDMYRFLPNLKHMSGYIENCLHIIYIYIFSGGADFNHQNRQFASQLKCDARLNCWRKWPWTHRVNSGELCLKAILGILPSTVAEPILSRLDAWLACFKSLWVSRFGCNDLEPLFHPHLECRFALWVFLWFSVRYLYL